MAVVDPLQTARTLVRLGLDEEAIDTLERARAHEPGREDVRRALAELRQARTSASRAYLALDLVMAWLLLIGTGASIAWLGYLAVTMLSAMPLPTMPDWAETILVIGLIACCVALMLAWVPLFLHAWFGYLKYLSRANRAQLERRLPSYFQVRVLEPQYSTMRRRYFGDT